MCVYRESIDGCDEHDKLDALHDAWVELYPKYESNLHPGALRNRAQQRKLDSFRRSNRSQPLQGNAIEGDPEIQPEIQFLKNERTRIVQECVRTLPPRHAKILRLMYWDGKSPAEIAVVVGRPVKTIYRWLSDARDSLAAQTRLREIVR